MATEAPEESAPIENIAATPNTIGVASKNWVQCPNGPAVPGIAP